jgi:hypothetical protein
MVAKQVQTNCICIGTVMEFEITQKISVLGTETQNKHNIFIIPGIEIQNQVTM